MWSKRCVPSTSMSMRSKRLVLLGRVALVTDAAGYRYQTFSGTICPSVGLSVCLSSALWENGGSDPDAVWHHRSDGSRDEACSGVWGSVHGKGYFWGRIWGAPLYTGTYRAYVCYSAATRPSCQFTLGRLVRFRTQATDISTTANYANDPYD